MPHISCLHTLVQVYYNAITMGLPMGCYRVVHVAMNDIYHGCGTDSPRLFPDEDSRSEERWRDRRGGMGR